MNGGKPRLRNGFCILRYWLWNHPLTPIDLFSRERAAWEQFDTDGSNERDGDQVFSPLFHAFIPSFSAFSRDEGDVEQIDRGDSPSSEASLRTCIEDVKADHTHVTGTCLSQETKPNQATPIG